MARKKTIWGTPGQTGVTSDGIPWRVPDTGPSFGAKLFYTLWPGGGTYMPAGAQFVPANTPAEVRERAIRAHGDTMRELLRGNEELHGFVEFFIIEKVPQPPRGSIEAKAGPNRLKQWWMGGDWESMAGQLIISFGSSRYSTPDESGALTRTGLLIRTNRRIMIWGGSMKTPVDFIAEYALDQIGRAPGWQPDDSPNGQITRVDIAFPDGSWLAVESGASGNIPGRSTNRAGRDLFAELVGPPVTADTLPALGRG